MTDRPGLFTKSRSGLFTKSRSGLFTKSRSGLFTKSRSGLFTKSRSGLFTKSRSGLFTKSRSGLCALLFCLMAPAYAGIEQDRLTYAQSIKDLNAGRNQAFASAHASLQHYLLFPYIEYARLRHSISLLDDETVQNFREKYADTPLAERLYRKWLSQLADKGEWLRYRNNYENSDSTTHTCYFLRALYHTSEKQAAMDGVEALWLNARSQPGVCDPLFATWIANGHLTQDLAWQRLQLALAANNRKLASYLLRYFNNPLKRTSMTYYQVHNQPKLLANHKRFSPDSSYVRNIIAHGLVRWANFDPIAAHQAWQQYRESHSFSEYEKQRLLQDIQMRMARNNIVPSNESVVLTTDARHEPVIEAIALAAVRTRAWSEVVNWVSRLPDQVKAKSMWRYWLARARLNQDDMTDEAKAQSQSQLQSLSRTRTYYGFLAAHTLGVEPRLNNLVSTVDMAVQSEVASLSSMQRALELYAINDVVAATREWLMLTRNMSKPELAAVSQLTANAGWLNQSIRSANLAELHDDLSLRFPTPYREIYEREARSSKVPETLLYGISRQESAFSPSVVSTAGAMGIMQLMPATAVEIARKSGLKRPVRKQLLQPETNIKLGSRYLAGLLDRYKGNRAVAAAAYNAGPSRANRWLKLNPVNPIDIWIETIPYYETRAYVKNVLAFTYIFSQHLNRKTPFLSENEAASLPSYVLDSP